MKIADLKTKPTFCTISLCIILRPGVEAVSCLEVVSRFQPGLSKSVIVSYYRPLKYMKKSIRLWSYSLSRSIRVSSKTKKQILRKDEGDERCMR